MRDMNLRHQLARVEIARHENARNSIVWNTECCICLSIANQECMSRQERAPDFATDCVLVNDSGAYTRVQFYKQHNENSKNNKLQYKNRSERPHHCCRFVNKVESIDCRQV